jgi:tRNA pseudouridine38-40 synthase
LRNIQLIIEYNGTAYHGWQRQLNAITVQEKLEEAIKIVTGEFHSVLASSRTDKGVHAKGQSTHFITKSKIPVERLPIALNNKLPRDIKVKEAIEKPMDFHSRYHAKGKKYSYHIINNTFGSAIDYDKAWHIPHELNLEDMIKANQYFIGTHDFSAFRSTGSSVKTSTRTILDSKIVKKEEKVILEIKGDGFLYNMVRIIMGTLVEVGKGKIIPHHIPDIIKAKKRENAGATAPAYGLYLEKVFYEYL